MGTWFAWRFVLLVLIASPLGLALTHLCPKMSRVASQSPSAFF